MGGVKDGWVQVLKCSKIIKEEKENRNTEDLDEIRDEYRIVRITGTT